MTTAATTAPAPLGIRIRSGLFEIAAQEPEHAPRIVLWVVATLCGLLIVWAMFAKLDIVAVAQGRLVPQTYVKIVQPPAAGIVREILIKEGDEVTEGQVLVRLDPTENSADGIAVARAMAMERLQIRRIDAELRGVGLVRLKDEDAQLFTQIDAQRVSHRQAYLDSIGQEQAAHDRAARELAAAREVLRKLDRTQSSYQRSAEAYEKLAAQKLAGQLQAEEARRAAIENVQDLEAQRETVASLEASVTESTRRLQQLKSNYESDLHNLRIDAVSKLTQLEQQQTKVTFQRSNLELRAPQAGKVKELATTTIGAVVQPGTVLVSLVPENEPLLAEVMINNEDIGFVRSGQSVRLKLATYPFQKYGMVDGVVKTVIADSQAKPQEMSASAPAGEATGVGAASIMAFKATIELKTQKLDAVEKSLPLAAGMQLSAEIVQGKRTVLEYLVSPVQRVMSESGQER